MINHHFVAKMVSNHGNVNTVDRKGRVNIKNNFVAKGNKRKTKKKSPENTFETYKIPKY